MNTTQCPYCGSRKVQRRGNHPKTRYMCNDDSHPTGSPRYFYEETAPAKILVFDIETLPGAKYFWDLGDEDWNFETIIIDWCVLSYSAKWLFEPEHYSDILTSKEARQHDDYRILVGMWSLLNEADIVIAHHGDKFDIPKLNARFIKYDMSPPSPYQSIDTRATAAKAFRFTSNKLDYLARYFGLGKKKDTDFDLWKRCSAGDRDALKDMLTYNEGDVYLLEDIYLKLRPWIKHPNMSLYMNVPSGTTVCPRCGSSSIRRENYKYTEASKFVSFRCDNCGGHGRSGKRSGTSPVRVI